MAANFDLTFDLSTTDIYHTTRANVGETFKKRSVLIGLVFLELLAIAGATGYLLSPKPDGSSTSLIAASISLAFVFPAIVLFMLYLNPYLGAKTIYKNNVNIRGSIHWHFSEERINVQMTTGSSELLWPTFIKARETKNLFLLYPQKQLANPIPKRAFVNEEEIAAFRELLKCHIKDFR